MTEKYNRILKEVIQNDLEKRPVVVITGPRQVGKTTLAKQLIEGTDGQFIYLDLERPSDHIKLFDAELYFSSRRNKLIIIDEVQRTPELFPIIRAEVDEQRTPGRFLLLGSSSDQLLLQSSESLAGRVSYRELHPFNVFEVPALSIPTLWLQGGYPEAFLLEEKDASQWLSNFVRAYISRELATTKLRIDSVGFERFVRIIATLHGQQVNYNSISRATGFTIPTLRHYLDFLAQSFLIRLVTPYAVNNKKRLVKSPKLYIRDSGILHNLLSISTSEELEGNLIKGASWEGFVIQQIISILPNQFDYYYYRTSNGAESDLVITKANKPIATFEIKYSNSPSTTKGMSEAIQDLACEHHFIVTPSSDEFLMRAKLLVIPIARLPHHLTRLGMVL